MGRHAKRAADVGPERQRPEAGGERSRGAARRASGGALRIIRVVGDPVDGVVALPVVEPDGHVGLAEDDRAGRLDAADDQRILGGPYSRASGKPQVVGAPVRLKLSLIVIGTPSNGPRSPRASRASASAA